jgi:hypothetical protein
MARRTAQGASARLERALGRHGHVIGGKAQLHIVGVAQHLPAGEGDADRIDGGGAITQQAVRMREGAYLSIVSTRAGLLANATASPGSKNILVVASWAS